MAFTRRSFAGGAVTTTLASGIGSADTSCTLVSPTGWPSGANGYFYVALEPNTTSEEKILCSSTVGSVVTFVTRGVDGTSPAGHNAGVSVQHVGTATDFDEANNLVSQILGNIGASGTYLRSTGSALAWGLADTGWTTIGSFQNTYSTADATNKPIRWRVLSGIVYLQGAITGGTSSLVTAFVLPASCYPSKEVIATVYVSSGNSQMIIDTSGNVSFGVHGPIEQDFNLSYPVG